MTKLIAKRIAQRFLKSIKGTYTPYGITVYRYTQGITIVYANFPWRVRREIERIAKEKGWDGCHWNDPTIIAIHEEEVL